MGSNNSLSFVSPYFRRLLYLTVIRMVLGATYHPFSSMKNLNLTSNEMWQLISGELAGKECPPTPFPAQCDVADVAIAIVRACEVPAARNQRYMMGGNHNVCV